MKMIFVVIVISVLLGGVFFFSAYHFLIKKGKNFPMIHFKRHQTRKENSNSHISSYKKQRKE